MLLFIVIFCVDVCQLTCEQLMQHKPDRLLSKFYDEYMRIAHTQLYREKNSIQSFMKFDLNLDTENV